MLTDRSACHLEFRRTQTRSLTGRPRYRIEALLTLPKPVRQFVRQHGYFNSVVFTAATFEQAGGEDQSHWLLRVLIADWRGGVIRVADLIDGVTVTAISIVEASQIETSIRAAVALLADHLDAIAGHDGSYQCRDY